MSRVVPAAGVAFPADLVVRRSAADYWGPRLTGMIVLCWMAAPAAGLQVSFTALYLLGLAAAILGVRHPALGLFGVGVLCTLGSVATDYHRLLVGIQLRYHTFNYWLLIVILIHGPFLLRLGGLPVRLLEGFVMVLMVGVLFSLRPQEGASDVLHAASALGLLVYSCRAARDTQAWYWLAVSSGTLAALGGLMVRLLQSDIIMYLNPNVLTDIPITAIGCACLAVGAAGGWQRRHGILGVLTAINFGWIFLSGSRGALLIAGLCTCFLLLQIRHLGRRMAWVAAAALLALVVLASSPKRAAYALGRMALLWDQGESVTERTSGRSELALAGWYIFLEHPLGVGTGEYGYARLALRQRRGLSMWRAGKEIVAHSGWVKVLAENGIPGIVLLAAFVGSFAAAGWDCRRRHPQAFHLGLLVSLLWALSLVPKSYDEKWLWLLATATMALIHRFGAEARAVPAGEDGEAPDAGRPIS